MKARRLFPVIAILGAALYGAGHAVGSSPASHTTTGQFQAAEPRSAGRLDALPVSFEINRGQAAPDAQFVARAGGLSLILTRNSFTLLQRRLPAGGLSHGAAPRERGTGIVQTRSTVQLLGVSRLPRIIGLDRLPGKDNYFIGNDPRRWVTDIPTYARVEYQNLYPGIDLVFDGRRGRLEYDWILRPGADARRIQLSIAGAGAVHIDRGGNLIGGGGAGSIVQYRPFLYQSVGRRHMSVAGGFVLRGHVIGIGVGQYDRTRRLIVDPVLMYVKPLGGTSRGVNTEAVAVDGSGEAFVYGEAECGSIPAIHAVQPSHTPDCSTANGFIAKLTPTGDAFLYSTYIGGNDALYASSGGIAVDTSGSAYVTGFTGASDFPTTPGAFQPTGRFMGGSFIAKLSPGGDHLVYSTYLGDYGVESRAIAIDAYGDAFVTGDIWVSPDDFPTQSALQPQPKGGFPAFVTELAPAGNVLVYSTRLGGSSADAAHGIAVDGTGAAYVTGETMSADFPTVHAIQSKYGSHQDQCCIGNAFVTKINPGGGSIAYSTYLGGNKYDVGQSIAVDGAGQAYLAGTTSSPNFPTAHPLISSCPLDTHGQCSGGFAAKLSAAGTSLIYSTYLKQAVSAVAIDAAGEAYVAGSLNAPKCVTDGASATVETFSRETSIASVSALSADGARFTYQTCLAAAHETDVQDIKLDASGGIYLVGGNRWDENPYVAKIAGAPFAPTPTPIPGQPTATATSANTPTPVPTWTSTPTATPTPTLGQSPTAQQLWGASVEAEGKLTAVHAKGMIYFGTGKKRQKVTFDSDCSLSDLHLTYQTKIPKSGKVGTAEFIDTGGKVWDRSHIGNGKWSKWIRENAWGAGIFLSLFTPAACPQRDAARGSWAGFSPTPGESPAAITVEGAPAWHLRVARSDHPKKLNAKLDIDQASHNWLRLDRNDIPLVSNKPQEDVATYSKFNEPFKLQPPKNPRLMTRNRRIFKKYEHPGYLAFDRTNNLYVADDGDPYLVRKLSRNGQVIWQRTSEDLGFLTASGIAVGPDGNLYLIDKANLHPSGTPQLLKISPAGTTIARTPLGNFFPLAIAFDHKGVIYLAGQDLAAAGAPYLIKKLSPDGTELKSWSSARLDMPNGIRVDGSGTVYVTQDDSGHSENDGVVTFSAKGKLKATWFRKELFGAWSIALTPADDPIVATLFQVVRLSRSGKVLSVLTAEGSGPGSVHMPEAVAVNSKGIIFVADYRRLQLFSPSGKLLAAWK